MNTLPRHLMAGLLGLLGLLPLAAPAADADPEDVADTTEPGQTDVVLTVEHSRGRYGEPTTTRITSVPLTLRHRQGRWTGEVEVPWQRISSSTPLLPGVGGVEGAASGSGPVEGLGDIWLKLGFEWLPFTADSTGVDLMLKVKTRTGAYERGLGSGGTDVALQFDLNRRVGPFSLFGHLGWRRTGDVPGARPYRDPLYGGLGAALMLPARCEAGLFHDLRQAIGPLGRLSETTAYGACRFGDRRVQLHATRGQGGASADLALGLSVRQRF